MSAPAVSAPAAELQLLCGAKAIAEAIGVTPKQVYHLREVEGSPIWNQPGLGLVAAPAELAAWFARCRAADQTPKRRRPLLKRARAS